MGKVYQEFPRNESGIIQSKYRCAGCWNQIVCGHDQDGDFMNCGTDDCNLPGLVSAKWVERRLQQSAAEWVETKQVLAEVAPWMKFMNKQNGFSIEANLKALGF